MMKEPKDFEKQWRKAFDNAHEQPPAYLWEQIEARLDNEDEQKGVIIPFWQNRRMWQIAASVAVLLLAGILGWKYSNHKQNDGSLSANQTGKSIATKKTGSTPLPTTAHSQRIVAPSKNENTHVVTSQEKNDVASAQLIKQSPETAVKKDVHKFGKTIDKNTSQRLVRNRFNNNASQSQRVAGNFALTTPSIKEIVPKSQGMISSFDQKTEESISIIEKSSEIASSIAFQNSVETIPTPLLANVLNLEKIQPKETQFLHGIPQKQIWVAYQPLSDKVVDLPKKMPKSYWASVDVMPARFNAGVGIGGSMARSAFAVAGQNSLAMTADAAPEVNQANNRSLPSYALQWQGGVQLGKRWAVETGVNFLQGNSLYEAVNGFNPLTNSYHNNLEAAIALSDFSEKSKAYAQASANSEKAQIQTLTTTQSISNRYQYLQIPVQAGFAVVKPQRKLSLWLLGGLINNIFLRHRFQTGDESTITLSGTDSPYRLLSWAATTGLRLQYKFHPKWATILTGNYQYSLNSTTQSTSLFESRPQVLGVGAGIRHGF